MRLISNDRVRGEIVLILNIIALVKQGRVIGMLG
jgi:hypothetical protein